MSRHESVTGPSPASFADFEEPPSPSPGWLQTLVQFFAIPLLIVCAAIGVFLGFKFLFGGGPRTPADFAQILRGDTINRKWQAAMELSNQLSHEARSNEGRIPVEWQSEELVSALLAAFEETRQNAGSDDPPMGAQHLLMVLGRMGHPSAYEAIQKAVGDKHNWIRVHAIHALGRFPVRKDETRATVLKHARHEDPQTRQAVLNCLANLDGKERHDAWARAELKRRENGEKPGRPPTWLLHSQTRNLAVESLSDRHEDVRFEAAIVLAYARDRRHALPILKRMLDRKYLETFKFDDSLPGSNRYTAHGNLITRAITAVTWLEAGDDPEVLAALEKLTDDGQEGDKRVRASAREALRMLREGT